jgi:hypothetical protein
MKRIRIQKPRVRAGRPWLEVLPVDPRDQTLFGQKPSPSPTATRQAATRGGEMSNDGGQPFARSGPTAHRQ